ncbi:MAG TPA: tyrosine-type recombinase/integrase [Candidatus Nitrosotalea sp.]|nr:tyrosine-type recombinase/integrase [Candidatus Nitrosotalea sp.]
MSRATEIYPLKRMVERELEKIKLDPRNSESLYKYYHARVAEGISLARICKCLNTLRQISRILGKSFEEATKDDFVRVISEVESSSLAGWTKRDYKTILKHFYKWLRNWEDGSPPEVRWIKKSGNVENKNPILPKDLLTAEEKTALLNATLNQRDRAFLEVLMESGRRPEEILTLHAKSIEFDEIGAKLFINGKVGNDTVRIISSATALAMWLENHPLKKEKDFPVWIGFGYSNRMEQLSHAAALALLKKIAKRAGLKKRIFFYLFRHTRIDESQGLLTEPMQCMMFGWKFGSQMPATYFKRYGKHIDNAQIMMNGKTPQQKSTAVEKPKTCIICKTENSAVSKFCCRCGKSLEIKFGVNLEDREIKMKEMLHALITDPVELENLRSYLAERRHEKEST